MTFSLLSNLSFPSRLRILPFFFSMLFAGMFSSVLRLRLAHFTAHLGAILYCIRNYKKILARRQLVKSIRRRSDREIFAKVMRTPRLDYFLKTLTGNLADYED